MQVDFVFLDPPYRMEKAYPQTLEALAASRLLKPESVVIAEHHKKVEIAMKAGLLEVNIDYYNGETMRP